MNVPKKVLNVLKKPAGVTLVVVVLVAVILAMLSYRLANASPVQTEIAATPTQLLTTPTPTSQPSPVSKVSSTPAPLILPLVDRSKILGIAGGPGISYPGIPWIRLSSPTCGWGTLRGDLLKSTIQSYHKQGIRILFSICQHNGTALVDNATFNDAAQAYPDAVQCGNEEMKQDASVSFLYVAPDQFAKFYNACASAIHKVRASTPVILGSLDPHVAGPDIQLMENQVSYLNQMQTAMNSSVHPGGHWNWRQQIVGLIDSWHNGWQGADNLTGMFDFWSQQFQVDMGQLGNHFWVIEGTGCFKGCGINVDSPYDVAVSHILTLISDVQVARQYHVPFFYFSGEDFYDQGINWPIGILDIKGHAKPIRQDQPIGRTRVTLTCGSKKITVENQLQLLSRLYNGCALPGNYLDIITS